MRRSVNMASNGQQLIEPKIGFAKRSFKEPVETTNFDTTSYLGANKSHDHLSGSYIVTETGEFLLEMDLNSIAQIYHSLKCFDEGEGLYPHDLTYLIKIGLLKEISQEPD
jgi:hypothetical protein